MRKLFLSSFAAFALLAFGMSAYAAQGVLAPSAAPDRDAVRTAQADKKPAAAPEGKKTAKKAPAKRQPTKKEMDEVRRNVPAEYHHYLPKGR